MTTTYYHAVGPDWQDGDDLLSASALAADGRWAHHWDDIDADAYLADAMSDQIALCRSLGECRDLVSEHLPGYRILRVTLPEGIKVVTNREGYPAVYDRIQAEYVELVDA